MRYKFGMNLYQIKNNYKKMIKNKELKIWNEMNKKNKK